MRLHLLALAFAFVMAALPGAAQTVTTLQQNGDPAMFVDIVFTGDGYTAAELAKFATDVQNAIAIMFGQEPNREYQRYFNIYRVDVASVESGADHPESIPPVAKNTAFDAAYNCAGIARLICVNVSKVTQAISSLAANQRDIVILLVNDNVYGGSGGTISVASTNLSSTEILLHELGHSFGMLADEYGGPPPPVCVDNVEPLEPNATRTAVRSGKWGVWIDPATSIPTFTTQDGIPGMYPGSRYCDLTLYRPTYNSKMRSLGQPFEQINTEALVKRIYNFISPVLSYSPTSGSVLISGTQIFSLTTPVPRTHDLSITWALDGIVIGNGLTKSLDASTVGPTARTLTATVTDATAMVRSDPANLLRETVSWTVTGAPSCSVSLSLTSMTVPSAAGNGTVGVTAASGCQWNAGSNASWLVVTSQSTNTGNGSFHYSVAANLSGTSRSGMISVNGASFSVTQAGAGSSGSQALRFVPVTPCRVADTRNPAGQFGGPALGTNGSRDFAIPMSSCNIPASAQAYSLNITVVPLGGLGFLSIWPTGLAQPTVSTLNSSDGRIKANAAIVPAGLNRAVTVFASHPTHVIVDINGYFVPAGAAQGMAFYPVAPCRLADTRQSVGTFGGPALAASVTRNFPVPSGSCGIPGTAQAYAINFTAVPSGGLGFLSAWPQGSPQPGISVLNSPTGTVTSNLAIVPAGTNGGIAVIATHSTHLIIDITGYFAAPGGAGALDFYPSTPCRILDTRDPPGPFGAPRMEPNETRSYLAPASSCGIAGTAKAYSLNATVVPPAPLGFLTLWGSGGMPGISTLNSYDGTIVANAALTPAGSGGVVTAFTSNPSHLILDINGFFQ